MNNKLSYPRKMALESPTTLGTVIHAIVIDQYGEEAYGWDPMTVYLELRDDFAAETCSEVMDRWCAIQILMTTDAFYSRLDAFLNICNTLASGSPAFDVFNPVTPEEAAWGVAEAALNRESLPFAHAVKKYVRASLKDEGYTEDSFPPIFAEIFAKAPSADDTRDAIEETKSAEPGLAEIGNNENLDAYIADQMRDMVSQFNAIPDLAALDGIIAERGFDEAMKHT